MSLYGPIVQCAANFSVARDRATISAIETAVRQTPGAVLADSSADWDHNRMVATILGPPESVGLAAVAAARVAVERIDLRHHTGAHPRAGAADVIPFTPIRGVTMEDCVALSESVAQRLGAELHVPVYLYERSAHPGRRVALPDIRKGGFEGLTATRLTGDRAPDFGPSEPHPTAGIAIVGARDPLVAYNVNLGAGRWALGVAAESNSTSNSSSAVQSLTMARRIARRIREERERNPALAGVRALGLLLESRGVAQVSMNLTQPHLTPLPAVFDYVRGRAEALGVDVLESEVIGLIPSASLGGEPPERIRWRGYRKTQIVEYWLG